MKNEYDLSLREDTYSSNRQTKYTNNSNMVRANDYYGDVARDPGKEGRKVSNIFFLRTFNNFIKASLIQNTVKKLKLRDFSVLDLCCGRGGDLDKFFQNNSKVYVGSDMAKELLYNAKDRIKKIKNENKKDNKCKCYLIEEDLSDPDNHLMEKIPKYIEFDIVSCQMSFHYHFGSEERIRAFLTNVVQRLSTGGQFICTIIDDNTLIKRLRSPRRESSTYKDDPLVFGNEFYSVKFEKNNFKISEPYGIKYGFYLEDSIDKRGINGEINYVEEYLIIFDNLVKICAEFDLYLEDKDNFLQYYEKLRQVDFFDKLFKRFIKGMDIPNYESQWEIIQLYQVVSFRKGINRIQNYRTVLEKFSHKIENVDEVVLKTSEFE